MVHTLTIINSKVYILFYMSSTCSVTYIFRTVALYNKVVDNFKQLSSVSI